MGSIRSSAVLAFFVATGAWGFPVVQLFTSVNGESQFVTGYGELVENLQPGTIVILSDGTRYQLGHELGFGNTTRVFEIMGDAGHVLRLPIAERCQGSDCRKYMDQFIRGAGALAERQVPAVTVGPSRLGEFAVVERVPHDGMKLSEFISAAGFRRGELPVPESEMIDALVDFARRSAAFADVADFHLEQLVFDARTRSWRLIDWMEHHVPYYGASQRTHVLTAPIEKMLQKLERRPVTEMSYEVQWLRALRDRVDRAVQEARSAMLAKALVQNGIEPESVRRARLQRETTCLIRVTRELVR